MNKIIVSAFALLSMVSIAGAQDVGNSPLSPSEVPAVTKATLGTIDGADRSYADALRECGAIWRNRGDKSEKGMAAWQAFRAMCTKDHYTSKRGKSRKG